MLTGWAHLHEVVSRLEAHNFPRAMLSENSSPLGADKSADKYPSIFSRQMGAVVSLVPFLEHHSNVIRFEKLFFYFSDLDIAGYQYSTGFGIAN